MLVRIYINKKKHNQNRVNKTTHNVQKKSYKTKRLRYSEYISLCFIDLEALNWNLNKFKESK